MTCVRRDGSKESLIKVSYSVIQREETYGTTSPTLRYVQKEGATHQLGLVNMTTSLNMLQLGGKCQT